MREKFFLNFFPNSEKNFKIFFKKIFLAFLESRNHDLRKFAKKNFWNFFPSQTWGWLGFAHIRSTCGPDLPWARHALRFDVYFRQGLPRRKVRCAPPVGPPPPIPNSFRGQTAPKRPDEMLFECVIWSRRFRTSAASASADCINGIIPGKAQFPKISCISRIQSCWTTLHLLSRLLLDHPVPI